MALPFATRTRYCPVRGNTRLSSWAVAMALPFATRTRYCPSPGNTRFLAPLLHREGQYAALRGYFAPTGRNTPRFLHATRRSRLPAGVVSVRHIGTHRAVVMRSSSLSARSLYSSHHAAICVIISVPHRLSFIAQKEVP